jgi:hypothetical protein
VSLSDVVPTGAVIESAVPHVGAEVHTSRVKVWVALGEVPLAAVIVMGYAPEVPPAGVPDRVAVPVEPPLLTKVTPLGRAPVSVNITGVVVVLLVVTVKLPRAPTPKLVELALVMTGALAANAGEAPRIPTTEVTTTTATTTRLTRRVRPVWLARSEVLR